MALVAPGPAEVPAVARAVAPASAPAASAAPPSAAASREPATAAALAAALGVTAVAGKPAALVPAAAASGELEGGSSAAGSSAAAAPAPPCRRACSGSAARQRSSSCRRAPPVSRPVTHAPGTSCSSVYLHVERALSGRRTDHPQPIHTRAWVAKRGAPCGSSTDSASRRCSRPGWFPGIPCASDPPAKERGAGLGRGVQWPAALERGGQRAQRRARGLARGGHELSGIASGREGYVTECWAWPGGRTWSVTLITLCQV